jgi:hypothetical protein
LSSPFWHRPFPFRRSLLFPQAAARPPSTHNGWLLFAPKLKLKFLLLLRLLLSPLLLCCSPSQRRRFQLPRSS